MRMIGRRRWLLHLAVLAATLLPRAASADGRVEEIVRDRAAAHGVSPGYLVGVAMCESTLNPRAVNGRYKGLFQLGSPGELDRFYARGYGDPFNAWEASDFAAGRFAEGGGRAWSCA